MTIKIKVLFLVFKNIHLHPHEIPKLRGYFATQLKHLPLLHNHLGQGKFDYRFPRVQYRIIQGNPALIAFGEGIEVVKELFFQTEKIVIDDNKTFETKEKLIYTKEFMFGKSTNFQKYQFISPWLALNEENYQVYKNSDIVERQILLKRILKGNLVTMAKGFDYFIEDIEQIHVESVFTPKNVKFKNIKMQGFTGSFQINFHIPQWFGLGKQSTRGFGVINSKEKIT